MLLPTIMLWKVRITLRQKLALTGVFSLTVFVMTAAIIRMSMFSEDLQQYELSWLYTWSVVEMTVGRSKGPLPPPRGTVIGCQLRKR